MHLFLKNYSTHRSVTLILGHTFKNKGKNHILSYAWYTLLIII